MRRFGCLPLLRMVVLAALVGLALPVGGVSAASPVATAELITNGDFETPSGGSTFLTYPVNHTFDGWTVAAGSVDHIGGYWQAASGSQSVDLNGAASGAISQNIATVPEQRYRLRFALAGNPECGAAIKELAVQWGTTPVATLTYDTAGRSKTAMGWEYHEHELVAKSTITSLMFTSLTPGFCGPALDDVSVTGMDSAPPVTTPALSPGPNAAGWNRAPVTVTLSATDESGPGGVKEIVYSAVGAQTIPITTASGAATSFVISTEGETTITYAATDKAGNKETPKTLIVRLDETAPSITGTRTPSSNANGWNNSDVTVTFTCADALSGIVTCTVPVTLTAEGAGQSVTGTATDKAGNTASRTVHDINIDKTLPTITFTGNAGRYTVDQVIVITCTANDDLSGIASATCPNVTAPAYSYALGANTLTATASDRAGNVRQASTSFMVQVTEASLCQLTRQFVTKQGIANSLCAKLEAAAAAAARGNNQAKAGALEAYRHEVAAQSGKSLTPERAVVLTRLASAYNAGDE